MRCANCGAYLRPEDHFCSHCGFPVRREEDTSYIPEQETDADEGRGSADEEDGGRFYGEEPAIGNFRGREPGGKRRFRGREPLYDEHLFRDSFLDKTEEGQHALLVTLAVLLVIASVTLGGVALFTYMRQSSVADNQQAEGQSAARQSGTASAGNDDIVILTEGQTDAQSQGQTETDAQAQTQTETQAQGQTETGAQAQTQTETQAQGQTETGAQAALLLDSAQMAGIMEADSAASRYGIYVCDLSRDQEYAAGASEEKMFASAAITVPILYTAASALDQGAVTLNDTITYVNSIGGRGEADPQSREGQQLPLSYYLTTMLTYSDNNCINCLIDFFGLDKINSTCHAGGFSSVDIQRKIVAEVTDGTENYLCAADLGRMVRQLYGGSFQTIGRSFMDQYFRIDPTDANDTLVGRAAGLPAGVTLLNQNGRGDTRYSEVAVITDGDLGYIISVMCSGDAGFAYETAVMNLSNYVYQSLSKEDAA